MMKYSLAILLLVLFIVFTATKAQIEDDPNLDNDNTEQEIERCYRPGGAGEEIRNLYCETWVGQLDKENDHIPRYCNGNGVCTKRGNKTYAGTKDTDLNQETDFCFDAFHPAAETGTGNKCFSVANWGCVIPDGETNYRRCAARSTRAAGGDKSCVAPTDPAATEEIVGLDAECGINNKADTPLPINCGYNLKCSSQRKCVPKQSANQYCTTNDDCRTGLLCSSNVCTRLYSIEEGQFCDSTDVIGHLTCKTGYCGRDSRCTHTSTQRSCIKDADCNTDYVSSTGTSFDDPNHANTVPVHEHTVCLIEGKYQIGKSGSCSAFIQPAAADLQNCLYSQCFNPAGDANYNPKCVSSYTYGMDPEHPCIRDYVRYQCARNCAKGFDRRVDSSIRYNFDCDDRVLSATAWKPTDCEIQEQFKNCHKMVWYPSSATLSSPLSLTLLIAISIIAFLQF